jgi:3-oxoacyl-[acyl-carrier-protein] synthase II
VTAERPPAIAVTGMGLVTAVGHDVVSSWASLVAGRPGITEVAPLASWRREPVVAARVPDLGPPERLRVPKHVKFMGRSAMCALTAMAEAVASAGDPRGDVDPYRLAIFAGSGESGLDYDEFFPALDAAWSGAGRGEYRHVGGPAARLVPPYFSLRSLANGPLALAAIELGALGAGLNFVQGATASARALAAAVDELRDGGADRAVAMGSDALVTSAPWLAYERAGLLSHRTPPRSCTPFDRARDGFALGEAGAALVLERADDARRRGARILGEIAGVAFSTTPDHRVSSRSAVPGDRAGTPAVAFDTTLASDASASDPVAVVAFGDATTWGGRGELARLEALIPRGVPVTAVTGATGFVGAATSVVQAVVALCALEHGRVPAIVGLVEPETTHLDLVCGAARPLHEAGCVLCLADDFTGGLAAVSVRRARS